MPSRFLKKVSERVAPPGREMWLLRLMPRAMLVGTLVPIAISAGARFLHAGRDAAIAAKAIRSVDIFSIALLVTTWTAIVTVLIGAIVVYIMKGPAYEADSYPLPQNKRDRR